MVVKIFYKKDVCINNIITIRTTHSACCTLIPTLWAAEVLPRDSSFVIWLGGRLTFPHQSR